MSLPYFDPNVNVWGPYLNTKQNRRFVTICNKQTGKTTQKTYAKYLMEVHLGRELGRDETVDHIDRDKLNDVIGNLQILSPKEHAKADSKTVNLVEVNCAWCNEKFHRSPRFMRMRASCNQAGPFCSGSCRGKYGASLQNGGKRLPAQEAIQSTYSYKAK